MPDERREPLLSAEQVAQQEEALVGRHRVIDVDFGPIEVARQRVGNIPRHHRNPVDTIEMGLEVTWVREAPTATGSYMHRLTDEQGNTFVAFLPEKLQRGEVYEAEWKITKHEEFRGEKQNKVATSRAIASRS